MSKNVETKKMEESKQRTNQSIAPGCLGGVIVAIIAFFVAFIYFGQNAYELAHLQIVFIISLIVAVLAGLIGVGVGVAVVAVWPFRKKEAEEGSS